MSTVECDPYAPFSGQPHVHMTETEMEAARKRPYPEGFTEWGEALRLRAVQREHEVPRGYIEPEVRTKVEPKAKRRVNVRRK